MRLGKLQRVIKQLADESGARHYEHMTDDTLGTLRDLQGAVMFAASQHSEYDEMMAAIQRYCDFTNGLGAQLSMPLKLVQREDEECPVC